MKDIGEVQSRKEPAKNKVSHPDYESIPRPPLRRSRIHTSEHVEKNDEITSDVIDFHEDLAWEGFKQETPVCAK